VWAFADYPTVAPLIEFSLQVIETSATHTAHYSELVSTNCEGAVCLSRQWEERTRKDGENRLMDGLYLPCVQYVACEEGYYEQHYQDGQGP
jgi:hypothetical protein